VLAGKGVGALQEAGELPVTLLGGVPRIELLGFYPTLETITAQFFALAALVLGFRASSKSPRETASLAA